MLPEKTTMTPLDIKIELLRKGVEHREIARRTKVSRPLVTMVINFHNINILETVWINGEPWFTREAIGRYLKYQDPVDAIKKIERRHPSIKQFSMKVKFPSLEFTSRGDNLSPLENGKIVERERTVYNFIGLQLIVAYSNRPERDAYLLDVAQGLDTLRRGKMLPSRWCGSGNQLAMFQQLLSYPPKRDRGEIVIDIAKQEGVHPNTIYRRLNKTGEYLVTSQGGRKKSPPTKGTHGKPEEVAAIVKYRQQHPNAKGIEIKAALGLTYSAGHINLILRQRKAA